MSYTIADVTLEISYYLRNITDGASIKGILAVFPALFSALFMGEWYFFILWFLFNVIDLFLGVWLALKTKDPESGRSVFCRERLYGWVIKTLTHAGTIFIFGAVTVMISTLSGRIIPIIDWFIFILVLTEMASILNSANLLGLPIPPFALIFVRKLKGGAEKKIERVTELLTEEIRNGESNDNGNIGSGKNY